MSVPLDRLYSLSRGELPPDEADALRRQLDADPALRAEYERISAFGDRVAASRAPSFGPYFADRVLARVEAPTHDSTEASFADALRSVFLRVAVACLGAIAVLSFVAEREAAPYGESFVASALGLPPTRVETLFLLDAPPLGPAEADIPTAQ
ncbi:MAG: hypothetical protein AAF170_02480 [Bacteroidota bacterium]